MRYFLIFLCGGLGSLARYLVSLAITTRYPSRFPWGTFTVNITGSFVIGLLMALFTERVSLSPNWRFALVVGFLGGYTTFSSFEWESYAIIRNNGYWIGVANLLASVIAGYAAVWLGAAVARR